MTFSISKDTANTVKVISALMVMFHHYSQYVEVSGIYDSIVFKLLSTQGGYIGVALFFFLSGYGLMESEQKSHLKLSAFFKRRFLKIYLPVLLVSTLWFAFSPLLLKTQGVGWMNVGEGNWHIIKHIALGFGDGILWFVRVLFVLYSIFYLFSEIYIYNKRTAIALLVILTIMLTVFEAVYVNDFKSISIPYFSLGVLMSLFKARETKAVVMSVVALVCFAAIGFIFYNVSLAGHSAINAFMLAGLIVVLSIRQWQIKVPAVLSVISFDLYLIHNKVLMVLKGNMEIVTIEVFVIVTLITTLLFYLLRHRILKI